VSTQFDPPPVLKSSELTIERYRLPGGQIATRYVRKSDGKPVGLQETVYMDPQQKLDPPAPSS